MNEKKDGVSYLACDDKPANGPTVSLAAGRCRVNWSRAQTNSICALRFSSNLITFHHCQSLDGKPN
ncbi:hypothetical protein BLOT_012640 [Blomia tropicalis]|nr:hypothetical protein BLOT_012640 [Blomia tropicalis]